MPKQTLGEDVDRPPHHERRISPMDSHDTPHRFQLPILSLQTAHRPPLPLSEEIHGPSTEMRSHSPPLQTALISPQHHSTPSLVPGKSSRNRRRSYLRNNGDPAQSLEESSAVLTSFKMYTANEDTNIDGNIETIRHLSSQGTGVANLSGNDVDLQRSLQRRSTRRPECDPDNGGDQWCYEAISDSQSRALDIQGTSMYCSKECSFRGGEPNYHTRVATSDS